MKTLEDILKNSDRDPRLSSLIDLALDFLRRAEIIKQSTKQQGPGMEARYISTLYRWRLDGGGFFRNIRGVEETIMALGEIDAQVWLGIAETSLGPVICWFDQHFTVKGILMPAVDQRVGAASVDRIRIE